MEASPPIERHHSFTITDSYTLDSNNGGNELHFMTSATVHKEKEGLLQLITGDTKIDLQYDPAALQPLIEPIPITDSRLLQSWPKLISRIIFKCLNRKNTGSHAIVFRVGS